jgi:hypothetical protein
MDSTTNLCELCHGTGFRRVERGGYRFAERCECVEQKAIQKADEQRQTKGKEELNLCSVALYDFSRGRKGQTHLILREWTRSDGSVFGIDALTAPEIGLPTAKDQDLLIVLEQFTREQGIPDQVSFNPADLIRRLGHDSKNGYRDTRKGFERLCTMQIRQWSGWYDKGQKKTTTVAGFHILDAWFWPTREDIKKKGAVPGCWFSWGLPVRESMRNGAWKALDLGVYGRFRDPVARFVYRYAERSLHGREQHHEPTEHFYRNVLGLSWNDNSPAMMVKVLQKHLAELPEVAGIGVRVTPAIVEFRRLK